MRIPPSTLRSSIAAYADRHGETPVRAALLACERELVYWEADNRPNILLSPVLLAHLGILMAATKSHSGAEMPGVLDSGYGAATGDTRLLLVHFRYRGRLIAAA